MKEPIAQEIKRETGSGVDLWRVIAAPIVWALHFLFCYVAVAIYCEKAGRAASLVDMRATVGVATFVALAAIGWSSHTLWRVYGRSLTDNDLEFEHNTPEERHRFLSHVALMLCVLSAVAVLFVALPAFYLATCR